LENRNYDQENVIDNLYKQGYFLWNVVESRLR